MSVTHTLWWLIGAYGLNAVVLGGALLIFGWPAVIGTKAGRFMLLVVSVGAGAATLYARGQATGRSQERKRQEAENADYLDKLAKDDAVRDRLPDDDLDRLLGHPRDTKAGPTGG